MEICLEIRGIEMRVGLVLCSMYQMLPSMEYDTVLAGSLHRTIELSLRQTIHALRMISQQVASSHQ